MAMHSSRLQGPSRARPTGGTPLGTPPALPLSQPAATRHNREDSAAAATAQRNLRHGAGDSQPDCHNTNIITPDGIMAKWIDIFAVRI
eukprot:1194233-Prorocentrum_minimum.AAC.1